MTQPGSILALRRVGHGTGRDPQPIQPCFQQRPGATVVRNSGQRLAARCLHLGQDRRGRQPGLLGYLPRGSSAGLVSGQHPQHGQMGLAASLVIADGVGGIHYRSLPA